jgi:alpha-glucosidase
MLRSQDDDPRLNHEGDHDIHRGIRSVLDDYPHAVSIGEIWVFDNEDFAKYLRPDELHMGFNFRLVRAEFDAVSIHGAIENALGAASIEDASPTWTLSNHDVDREVTRYGDGVRGLARARAMAMVMLALPGAVFVYNGEELGLPNVELPDEVLQDPVWERSGHTERGRDACRVPMPWSGSAPPFGFSSNPDTWLPIPSQWDTLTVARQEADPDSTLSFFRSVLQLRRSAFHFTENDVEWLQLRPDVLAFFSGGVLCVLNTGTSALSLPAGEVLASSAALSGTALPPDSAAWVVPG